MKIKAVIKNKNSKSPLYINTEFIPLSSALKLAGIASTGGQAKLIISEKNIVVNGEVCTVIRKKLKSGDTFKYKNEIYEVISK